ncbi:hypothetical protein [Confluentibacter sediminis]|uniref:hypothetical protein n=1 Tax=Confluentibacter sediminis TaxID=2219045 RepID=UPI000DAE59AB|nr:hypothetical protein [Confluentibacter sediminis]
MKRIITIAIISCFIACKQETKSQNDSQQDTQNIVQQDSKNTPYTKAQFKEAFPNSINGLPLDDKFFSENQMAVGTYGDDKIELVITDCSEKHKGLQETLYMAYDIKLLEDEYATHENKERHGIKTINNYRKHSKSSEISFVYHNRWYFVLKGEGMSPDELWNVFDINLLKNFKN